MPKQAYLAPHFSPSELRTNYRQSKDPVEARRWHFLWKVALGWTVTKSALAVGISQSYGWKILKNYNAKGLEGVKNEKKNSQEHSRGSKPLLNTEQLQKLSEELKKRPSDGGIWTGPKVARWIEKETGIEKVWNQRGWNYLKKSKYSCQKPRPKHRKGNQIEQEQFKQTLPLLKNYEKNFLIKK